MTETEKRTGGCLCGAVRFEIAGSIEHLTYCHCTQCRRQTGHFSATAGMRKHNLKLVNENSLAWYQSSAQARRGFCRTCGSSLFWEQTGQDSPFIAVFLGSLDSSAGLTMKHHMHVADKGDYYPICDGLPLFEGDDGF